MTIWNKRAEDSLLLVAYIDDEPVGFSLSHPKEECCWHIWLAGVLLQHRSNGIWSRMYQEIVECARETQHDTISIATVPEKYPEMYRSLVKRGFVEKEKTGNKIRLFRNICKPVQGKDKKF